MTNMARGYSIDLIAQIKQADKNLLGVKLGRFCTDEGIPVMQIADHFNVTRTTVYNWFTGKTGVARKHIEAVEQFVKRMS
jgi:hypothetical protein